MIKAKKIGLILNEEIMLTTKLKNGMVVSVICEFKFSVFFNVA